MGNEALLLMAIGLTAVSGVPGLLPDAAWGRLRRVIRPAGVHAGSAAVMTAGAALGLFAAARALNGAGAAPIRWAWALPGAEFAVAMDALSACFVMPVLLIAAVGAWFGLAYWPLGGKAPRSGRVLCFYGLSAAAMALVTVARNGVLFLAAWEAMAVSAFLLVATEEDRPDVREAGWIYFVATHASTLLLFGLFGLMWAARGTFGLEPFASEALSPVLANGIFLVAAAGFGIKAGLFPGHVWLPPAHASAPSHVSALMSGVLIKMGVYGVARVTSLLAAPPPWWGGLLLGLGVVSGVLGVVLAIGQHDVKRLLAYHSIENVGIIFMGMGLAVSGRALGDGRWIALGLGAAVLHTWNHGLFKSLLFLGAGAVLHRTHTRDVEALGGLAKPMPGTALLFLVGAAAICGLPPLNGFVSELLLYLGMFGGFAEGAANPAPDLGRWVQVAIGIPALALIGGLALACFVKVTAAVFLGEPRSQHAHGVREVGPAMLAPMALLAALCAGIGIAPLLVMPWLDRAVASWAAEFAQVPGSAALGSLAPWTAISGMNAVLWGALLAGGFAWGAWRLRLGGRASETKSGGALPRVAPAPIPIAMAPLAVGSAAAGPVAPGAVAPGTWDCGYVRPTARMQYTGSAFAQLLTNLWRWVLMPTAEPAPRELQAPLAVFPGMTGFASHVPDAVLDRLILPALRSAAWLVGWLRLLQRGRVQDYLLYVFVTLLVLLLMK